MGPARGRHAFPLSPSNAGTEAYHIAIKVFNIEDKGSNNEIDGGTGGDPWGFSRARASPGVSLWGFPRAPGIFASLGVQINPSQKIKNP